MHEKLVSQRLTKIRNFFSILTQCVYIRKQMYLYVLYITNCLINLLQVLYLVRFNINNKGANIVIMEKR